MNILIKTGITVFLLLTVIDTVYAEVTNFKPNHSLFNFLDYDKTNKQDYTSWHTCGHFARELSLNASLSNMNIGSALVSNHPVFKGHLNHVINYVYISGEIMFIEPQTDEMLSLDDVLRKWKYIKLYPDGSQVPSFWRYNLAPTITGKPI